MKGEAFSEQVRGTLPLPSENMHQSFAQIYCPSQRLYIFKLSLKYLIVDTLKWSQLSEYMCVLRVTTVD